MKKFKFLVPVLMSLFIHLASAETTLFERIENNQDPNSCPKYLALEEKEKLYSLYYAEYVDDEIIINNLKDFMSFYKEKTKICTVDKDYILKFKDCYKYSKLSNGLKAEKTVAGPYLIVATSPQVEATYILTFASKNGIGFSYKTLSTAANCQYQKAKETFRFRI
jgi:hypothetical protein